MRFAVAMLAAVLIVGGKAQAQSAGNALDLNEAMKPQGLRLQPDAAPSGKWTVSNIRGAKAMPLPKIDAKRIDDYVRARKLDLKTLAPADGMSAERFKSHSGHNNKFSANVRLMPLVFAGKLFFDTSDGDMVCSAQFISSRILLTAAHCIQNSESGEYYRNFAFALQYERGGYAALFDAACVANMAGWHSYPSPTNYLFDYAMILVNTESNFGYFGYYWNWAGMFNSASRIGYPGGLENGQIIQVDSGPLSIENGIVALRQGTHANQHGSSGGAWVWGMSNNFSQQSNNRIISVTSFGDDNNPEVIYGPYLTDAFKTLYDYTARGCR